jgi:hypothetical protein
MKFFLLLHSAVSCLISNKRSSSLVGWVEFPARIVARSGGHLEERNPTLRGLRARDVERRRHVALGFVPCTV